MTAATSASRKAWVDLIEAIALLAQHPTSDSPFHCEDEQLTVLADDTAFTDGEIARLVELGFHRDEEGGFYSFRYGSA